MWISSSSLTALWIFDVHKKLIKHFKKSKREEKIIIGKKLEKLRTSRNDADYINRDINMEDVEKSRTTSEEIIDSIEKLWGVKKWMNQN